VGSRNREFVIKGLSLLRLPLKCTGLLDGEMPDAIAAAVRIACKHILDQGGVNNGLG
jgi:hypothetical protein